MQVELDMIERGTARKALWWFHQFMQDRLREEEQKPDGGVPFEKNTLLIEMHRVESLHRRLDALPKTVD